MKAYAYINGRIYVQADGTKIEEALVTLGERIIFVGSSEKAKKLVEMINGEVIDLEGRTVLPGFIDAHMHVDGLAIALESINLRSADSINEVKKRVKDYYESHRNKSWILGRGWDQELFREKRWPTRWDLDEAAPDKPVFLERVCGHAGVLNTKALEVLGLLENPPANPNFHRNEIGELTGLVFEDAVEYVRENITFENNELKEMLFKALLYAASQGVTTVGFVSCTPRILGLLEALRLEIGRLPIRVRIYLTQNALEAITRLGLRCCMGSSFIKVMGIKLFTDGSLGARTAWLTEPYADEPGTQGRPVIRKDELIRIASIVDEKGLQLAIHAIGDKACDMVIEAYRRLGPTRIRRLRHRIEHASIIRGDQITVMSKLGAIAVVQPHFVISDWWVLNRLGRRRVEWIYPFKTMLRAGIRLAFSTDAPVEPISPWETIYAAVTRGIYENTELGMLTPNERLEISEALKAYTIGSAYALHEDKNLGKLEPGAYADFIVVDRDPFNVSFKDLRKIKTIATIVGGQIVYKTREIEI